jgi:hypothetical protein
MEDLFRDYWWLMFPIGGMLYGGWERYLAYRTHANNLELMKTYAAQGKEPPAQVAEAVAQGPLDRRDYRRGRWTGWDGDCDHRGPVRDWRRTAFFTAMAGAFFFASTHMNDGGDLYHPFSIVSVVFAALALASLVTAIIGTVWKPK